MAFWDVKMGGMGTSVAVIESYYGKHATPQSQAAQLGGKPRVQ